MKPDANDLRRARVAAYENNDSSQRPVAALFGVSPATGRNILRRKRATGMPDLKPRGGGQTATRGQPGRDRVRPLLTNRNDLTLAELCDQSAQAYPQRVSVPTMCRVSTASAGGEKKDAPRGGTRHAAEVWGAARPGRLAAADMCR